MEGSSRLLTVPQEATDCICKEAWDSEMSDGIGKMRLWSKAIGQPSDASKDKENLEKENW